MVRQGDYRGGLRWCGRCVERFEADGPVVEEIGVVVQ